MKRKVKAKSMAGVKKTANKASKKSATRVAKGKPRPVPAVSPKTDGLDALVLASAQVLRLPLDPAWRGGVKFNLQLILNLGALVDGFALPDDADPAPVFHA